MENFIVKKGACFKGFRSTIAGFFMLVTFVSAIVAVVHGNYIASLVLFSITIPLVNLFLGFEGVEFDSEMSQFRRYRSSLGMKSGKWQDLSEYSVIALSGQYVPGGGGRYLNFEINLAGENKKSILLEEVKSYDVGKKRLEHYKKHLDLEVKDYYAQRVKSQYKKERN